MLQLALPDWTTLQHDLRGAAVLVVGFVVVFVVAELLWRLLRMHTEVTRKVVHIGGGVVVLSVPHLLTSVWSALALAASFAIALGVAQRCHFLPSVHAIDRRSVGAAVFPLAVGVCVLVSRGELVRFEVPLLALALGDAAAALIGRRFGTLAYAIGRTRRTVEGSAAFVVVVAVVAAVLFCIAGVDVPMAVAVAVPTALVLAVVEAISIDGWDNLTIPVAGLVVVDIAIAVTHLTGGLRAAFVVAVLSTFVAAVAATIAVAVSAPAFIKSVNAGRVP